MIYPALLLAALGGRFTPGGRSKPKRPTRPCLQCKKAHNNSNAYCSSKCCEEYRKGKAQ